MALSLQARKGVTATLHCLAFAATIFRLLQRYRKRRWWWDDCWALLALLFDIVFFSTLWFRGDETDGISRKEYEGRILSFWLTTTMFPSVIWSARISIGLSIVRLVPESARARKLLYAMLAAFGLVWLSLLLYRVTACGKDKTWHHNRFVYCNLGTELGVIALISDTLADTCLIVIPLRMLRRVKLPSRQRRLILSIFASSVLSTLCGILYAVFIFISGRFGARRGVFIGLATHINGAVTLLVCNLLVIVTYIFCLFKKTEDDDVTEPSETRSKPSRTVPPSTFAGLTFTQVTDMQTSGCTSHSPRSIP